VLRLKQNGVVGKNAPAIQVAVASTRPASPARRFYSTADHGQFCATDSGKPEQQQQTPAVKISGGQRMNLWHMLSSAPTTKTETSIIGFLCTSPIGRSFKELIDAACLFCDTTQQNCASGRQ
jgi:hypothetical protein